MAQATNPGIVFTLTSSVALLGNAMRTLRAGRPAGRGLERRKVVRARRTVPLFGLAPGGVCLAAPVTRRAVCSYHAFSPLRGLYVNLQRRPAGRPYEDAQGWALRTAALLPCAFTYKPSRYVSVALSLGLRRAGVTRHPVSWSPDFPREFLRCLPCSLAANTMRRGSRLGCLPQPTVPCQFGV